MQCHTDMMSSCWMASDSGPYRAGTCNCRAALWHRGLPSGATFGMLSTQTGFAQCYPTSLTPANTSRGDFVNGLRTVMQHTPDLVSGIPNVSTKNFAEGKTSHQWGPAVGLPR